MKGNYLVVYIKDRSVIFVHVKNENCFIMENLKIRILYKMVMKIAIFF